MTHPLAPHSSIVMVAAIARNRVLGANGTMPWHYPADLAHFKKVTMGHPMLMGRTTFDSMGALPGRTSVVLTRDPHWSRPGVLVAHTLDDALVQAAQAPGGQKIMVVGGATLYAQCLPFADVIYLTHLDLSVEGDTFFPQVDFGQWQSTVLGEQPDMRFMRYDR